MGKLDKVKKSVEFITTIAEQYSEIKEKLETITKEIKCLRESLEKPPNGSESH